MNLAEKINDDLKIAMKTQDKETLSVLRMVKGAIQLAKVEWKHELSDEEVIDIISKQIKMRKDSIIEFSKANREDLVAQYQQEIELLKKYMPEQLTSEAVDQIITEAFQTIQPTSPKQMGLIMKEITPKVKGKFDMGEISKRIKEKLTQE